MVTPGRRRAIIIPSMYAEEKKDLMDVDRHLLVTGKRGAELLRKQVGLGTSLDPHGSLLPCSYKSDEMNYLQVSCDH